MVSLILITMLVMSIFGVGWCVWDKDFAFAISFTIATLGIIKEMLNHNDKGGQ